MFITRIQGPESEDEIYEDVNTCFGDDYKTKSNNLFYLKNNITY